MSTTENTKPQSVVFKLADEDQRLVFAEVYAPNLPDTDNDFMDAEGIQKMAYKFMTDMNLRQIDVQHDNNAVAGACVVESFIARKGDPDFIEGAWVVGVHIADDETWNKVKKGEINGFSMEAMVTRTKTQLEIEVPPVIRGLTAKAADDDHEHEFFVTYDPEGNFVGGRTGMAEDGHFHEIRKGTTTETTNNHFHLFSFVEGLIA